MSGFNTPRAGQPVQQQKQMSNRLMTMKFMQRAAANTERSQSQPSTPSSEPALKRRKTETPTPTSGANSPAFERSAFLDRKAITAAVRAEEATEALARARSLGEHGIETEWILPVTIPALAANGHNEGDEDSENDDAEEDIWSSQPTGRQTFGSFKGKKRTSMPKPDRSGAVENDANLNPARGADATDSSDSNSDIESGEASSSSENESASRRKRKAQSVNYENDAEMARLDRIDLSKSSYAQSKGAFVPPKVGFGQQDRQGRGKSGNFNKRKNKPGKKPRRTL